MKKCLIILGLFMVVPVLLGMGQGPVSPEKIPVPAKKFAATFIDQIEVVTECQEVSIEGRTFIEGKRGDGLLKVPFELIDRVTLTMSSDRLMGTLKLSDGNSLELMLKKDQNAYGRTNYGTFQIKLADLKKIIFPPPRKKN